MLCPRLLEKANEIAEGRPGVRILTLFLILAVVGMARCAVPARVERAEHARDNVRPRSIAPLNAARRGGGSPLAMRAVPTKNSVKMHPLAPFSFRVLA